MLKKLSPIISLVLNETATAEKPKTVSGFRTVVFNLGKVKLRHETLEGEEHLVIPMVMLTVGVHNGSAGPLYYPETELGRTPQVWNAKPITLGHPPAGASGCDPAIINSRKLGVCLNTTFDGRLASEAWLNKKRCKTICPELLTRLEKGESVEVSTGLWTENEEVAGTWNGEAYTAVARNHKPDHLAVLLDTKGACSLADGAGLLVNEVSFDSRRDLCQTALKDAMGDSDYGYVVDVFDKFFIYNCRNGMFKRNYTTNDTSATLSGEPVEVVRVIQYRTPDGTVVANAERKLSMNKAQLIAALITNAAGLFSEADKGFLESKDEKALQKIHDQMLKNIVGTTTNAVVTPPAAPVGATPLAPVLNATPVAGKAPSLEESLTALHPDVRRVVVNAINNENRAKEKLITDILTNKVAATFYTKENLAIKNVDELQIIANMAGIPAQSGHGVIPLFGGMADPAGLPATQAHNQAPLEDAKVEFANPFKK